MPPKTNRVTIAQVAEYAQVSTMTVSRVVNNRGQVSQEMRKRVQDAMQELNYRPNRIARSLVSNQTYKIGVIVPNISSMFFTVLLESIEHALWQDDYYMVLSNSGKSGRREQDILDVFEQDQVDGVLIFGSHLNSQQLTKLLQNQRAAVVINGEVDTQVAGQILFDDTSAIQTAVQHLVECGRRYLAYIGGDKRTYSMRQRRLAFEEAISQYENQLVGHVIDPDEYGVERVLSQHFNKHPHTNGIMCFNDETAANAMMVLKSMGNQIPSDIAVIGFDDTRVAQWVTPQLTTLRLAKSITEIGELAAKMLLERIEGYSETQPLILNHELIIRDSTP